jgi:hypothetical protein
VAEDKEAHPFHDSESEDIYDLYNACNGIIRDGLLDIKKLDDLSQEEIEILNLARLKEIWNHTAAGCTQCAGIVRTLNTVRGMLSENPDEIQGPDFNYLDLVS